MNRFMSERLADCLSIFYAVMRQFNFHYLDCREADIPASWTDTIFIKTQRSAKAEEATVGVHSLNFSIVVYAACRDMQLSFSVIPNCMGKSRSSNLTVRVRSSLSYYTLREFHVNRTACPIPASSRPSPMTTNLPVVTSLSKLTASTFPKVLSKR